MGDKASRQSPLDEAIDRILQQRSFSSVVAPSNSLTDLQMKDGKPPTSCRPGSAPSTPSAGSQAPSLLDSRGSKRATPTRQARMTAALRQTIKRPTTGSSNAGRRRNSAHSRLDMWRPNSSASKEPGKSTEESSRMNITVSTPGYTLSRSPSKVAIKIDTEKFFGASPYREQTPSARSKSSALTEVVALQRALNEVHEESLCIQTKLQEQLADQAYTLEKEKEKQKEEIRKLKADFGVKQQEAERVKLAEIRMCNEEHKEEVESLKACHKDELSERQAAATRVQAELKGELQFLQEAFDSYKTSVHSDMEEKWQRRETEIREQHTDEIEQFVDKAEAKLEAAKAAVKSELEKEHKLAIQKLQEGHEQHLKRLDETCQQAAESLRELDRVNAELQSLTLQNESMEMTIEQDRKTILSLQGELGETHAKLLDYESHFSQKVAEVEDQFRGQIHSLMTENTELRRRFMKKCDAYYHLQAEKDRIQRRQVKLLEQKMQALVEVQMESQSQVSLATQNLSPIMSTQLLIEQKDSRPISAPPEASPSISKDQMQSNKVNCHPKQRTRPKTCSTTVRTKIPDVFR